jgi:hypothetical protein
MNSDGDVNSFESVCGHVDREAALREVLGKHRAGFGLVVSDYNAVRHSIPDPWFALATQHELARILANGGTVPQNENITGSVELDDNAWPCITWMS